MNQLDQSLSQYLLRDLKIKDRVIRNRIVLSPMAGIGHIAFRQLVAEYGGFGLLFTGMCNAKSLPHENPEVSNVFKWRKEELGYLVCQIFGPDPQSMAKAASRIEKEGFFGVDLNFGCSVAAICKKGCGAALLKNPELSAQIVKAVRNAVSIPVFVKFRIGWENKVQFPVDMAKRFEAAGADALTFHPRIAPDRRSRAPRRDVIRLVKEAVTIPVFGNGNLFSHDDCIRMIKQTDCHGLSVGRMAVARPWIFAQWSRHFIPEKDIFYESASRYTKILQEYYPDHIAVKMFKKFSSYFCGNFKFGHQILKKLLHAETMTDIQNKLTSIFESDPEILEIPNSSIFDL